MSFYTPFAFYQAGGVAPSFDPDAQAYIDEVIAAGGTLSAGDQTAINGLYVSLKANSLYSEILYMYPFMGESADASAIDGINPTDADYTVSWSGILTNDANHTSAGINTTGGDGWGTINKSASTIHSSVDSVTLGASITSATTNNQSFVIGPVGPLTTSNRYQFNIPFDSNNVYIVSGVVSSLAVYNNGSSPIGRWIGSRISSTSIVLYKDGSSVNSSTVSNSGGTLNTNLIQFFTTDSSTGAIGPFNGVCGFLFGANGLDNTQVSTLDGILSTFLTAIGR